MSHCIKCGVEIPDGELFCQECSLNGGDSILEEDAHLRYTAPPGKMQTPIPVVHPHPHVQAEAQQTQKRKKGSVKGWKSLSVVLTLMLCGILVYSVMQYGHLESEKMRLRTKEADLALRMEELDNLEAQVADLTAELMDADAQLAQKEQQLQDLLKRMSELESSQGEGGLDETTQELERLESENVELLAMIDDLKAQRTELKTKLAATAKDTEKAKFLDEYVVFVEDNDTGYYHTYDCTAFSRTNFWAYSRKLAESQGYTPCPVCGGKP